jgi:hypothetical protein
VEIVGGTLCLLTLWQTHALAGQLIIVVGIIAVIFVACFEQLNNNLNPMINAVAEIQAHLSKGRKGKFVPLFEMKAVGYIQTFSPVDATPLGLRMLDASGGKKLVDEKYLDFEKEIDQGNCETAYDVQNCASTMIAHIENEPYMKRIKDYIYSHPEFEGRPLLLEDVQRVMVIYLRNAYLRKHPDIIPKDDSKKTR